MIEIDDRVVMLLFILFLGYMLFNRREGFNVGGEEVAGYCDCTTFDNNGSCVWESSPDGRKILDSLDCTGGGHYSEKACNQAIGGKKYPGACTWYCKQRDDDPDTTAWIPKGSATCKCPPPMKSQESGNEHRCYYDFEKNPPCICKRNQPGGPLCEAGARGSGILMPDSNCTRHTKQEDCPQDYCTWEPDHYDPDKLECNKYRPRIDNLECDKNPLCAWCTEGGYAGGRCYTIKEAKQKLLDQPNFAHCKKFPR